jgi:uncharacterized membrane protein YdjX (TVP38/TMEM64 family)
MMAADPSGQMRVGTFWVVSQIGVLPGTFLFVNAGPYLDRVASPRNLPSWKLIASFALLGLFPLLVRKTVQYRRARVPPATPS